MNCRVQAAVALSPSTRPQTKAQVLPGRLGRLQEAEARRLELEEAKRQEIEERAERKKHEAALARQAREAADLVREAEAMESLTTLRSRWEQADKKVAKVKNDVQRAAAERVAGWALKEQFRPRTPNSPPDASLGSLSTSR